MRHEIAEVLPGSIACELGILPGDFLLAINGEDVRDVLDFRFACATEELLLEIESDGEIWEAEIEKDADEDLGLTFSRPLMSEKTPCVNNCIFCFIDQQPRGLRDSLYFKDDDARLSFLHGNYVTLTNLSDAEISRLAGFHLSPLRISVHAADLALRSEMMGADASNLFRAIKIFSDAKIKMHFQIVLCKGINDAAHLDHTIKTLAAVEGAESLAVVPAGITRHREGLAPLSPFNAAAAKNVLAQIASHQESCRTSIGKTFVFAADEWYIISKTPLPPYEFYEDFPQLDNGVGMLRLFEEEFRQKFSGLRPEPHELFWKKVRQKTLTFRIGIITGIAAAEFMRSLAAEFMAAYAGVEITVHAVENHFFGENITVSGLLTGGDIIAQLSGRVTADILFIPENAFRADTEIMLDGTTLSELSAALAIPTKIGSSDGATFRKQLTTSKI